MLVRYMKAGGWQKLTPKRLEVLGALREHIQLAPWALMRETYQAAPKLCQGMIDGGAHWVEYDKEAKAWKLTPLGHLVMEAVDQAAPGSREVRIQA